MLEAMLLAAEPPDIVAVGGWHKLLPAMLGATDGGYLGTAPGERVRRRLFGRETWLYRTSHERCHIFGTVAMSPFDLDDVAVLVWEGVIGAFYRWREGGARLERFACVDQPGARYAALFALAEPSFPDVGGFIPNDYAGKLMALAAFADDAPPTEDSVEVVETLLRMPSLYPFTKRRFRGSPLHDAGVTDLEVCRAARLLSIRLFDAFLDTAREVFEPGLPLAISGGCGLNCDWNRAWREADHFSEVFVPPCANDTGSAIGAAVDALAVVGSMPRLTWSVYRGAPFVEDLNPTTCGWVRAPFDARRTSQRLAQGDVVAWVQGRCEIGPRALGNRSLLATAATTESHRRLNEIKAREAYRPIAPVCRE
jgi:hydroxymethyl cephem carbamoyltransferase